MAEFLTEETIDSIVKKIVNEVIEAQGEILTGYNMQLFGAISAQRQFVSILLEAGARAQRAATMRERSTSKKK